jgi:hypothetical protein
MPFYWLVIGILAVWRITHLFNAEDGPANLLVRLRRAAGSGLLGSLLDCFYCLSLWIAIPFALVLGGGWRERFFLWLALSAGAIVLERIQTPRAIYHEDEEGTNVLLQQGQKPVSDASAGGSGEQCDAAATSPGERTYDNSL